MSTLNYLLFSSKGFLLSIILSFPTVPEKKTGLLLTNTKTSSVQKKKKKCPKDIQWKNNKNFYHLLSVYLLISVP